MKVTLLSTVLLLTGFAADLSAQAWKLPRRGVVIYQRDRKSDPHSLGPSPAFDSMELPPVLLQGELDSKQQHQPVPPADLRDLPAWLAFDLRKASGSGPIHVTLNTLLRVGAISVSGTVSAVGSDGKQTIQATFQTSRELNWRTAYVLAMS